MNRIGEQTDAVGARNDNDLKKRSTGEANKRPFDCPDPAVRSGDRRINRAVGMAVFAMPIRILMAMIVMIVTMSRH